MAPPASNSPAAPQNSSLTHKSSVELFHIRLKTRLCIALLCMLQILPKLAIIFQSLMPNSQTPPKMLLLSFPCAPLMATIIGIEYLLFKKRGSKILKYSHLVDLILLLLFMTDWLIMLFDALVKMGKGPLPISYMFVFTSFSWRVLLATLIVQKWQLKIILPVISLGLCSGYAIYYDPDQAYGILFKSLTGLFNPFHIKTFFMMGTSWKIIDMLE